MSALQKISSGIASIPQRDLREVQAMNAFFIIPTNVRWRSGSSSRRTRRSKSGSLRWPRSRARWVAVAV